MDSKHHHRHRHHLWNRTQEHLSSFFRVLSFGPLVSLLIGLAVLPILYMGGEVWWLPLELIIALAGVFCWLLSYWWRGHSAGRPRFSMTILIFALPFLFAVIQCVPNSGLTGLLSPKAHSLFEGFNALDIAVAKPSISVAPDLTHHYILFLAIALLFHIMALSHCSERLKMRLMLLGIVCAALGNAGISFYSFFNSSAKGIINMPVFTGAFMNRNHFGFLMMLGIMCDLGLLNGIVSEDKHSHRSKSNDSDEEYTWNGWKKLVIPLGLILFVLLTALLLSLSRGAFVGVTVSLLVFGIIWLFKSHEIKRSSRHMILALMILVATTFILATPYGLDALSKRFDDISMGELTMDLRWLIWKDTVKLIADYRLAGVGLGCFRDRIQPYESGNITKALVYHAHNDYLELLSEVGVPMAILIFLGLAVFLCIAIHRSNKVHDPTYRWACFGILAAMAGAAVQEAFDYNLHAYPNLFILSVMLAILAVCVRRRGKSEEEITGLSHQELHKLNRKQRYGLRILMLPLTFVLIAVALPYSVRKLKASIARNKLIMEYEADTGEWTPRPGDYKRRIAYANAALKGFPNDHRALVYKSVAEVGLAMHKSVKRKQAIELLDNACEHIAMACSRAPGNGDAALECAKIYSLSNSMMVRMETLEQLLNLYDWAYRCYPKIISIVDPVSRFACRTYVVSKDAEPEHSEEFKKYALARIMDLIELRPGRFRKIYGLLPTLIDGYDKLPDIAPDTIPARKELIDFLMGKRQYDVALDVVNHFMEKLDAEKGFSEQELANYRLFAISIQNSIYEIKGEADKRAENWSRMIAAVGECERLKIKEKDAPKSTKVEFRMMYSDYTLQYFYDNALAAKNLGRINDVVHFLLPITYSFEKGESVELYRNSLELLSGWETYFDESIEVRAKYLENVLCILAAEAGGDISLNSKIEALEALEEKIEQQNKVQWFQRHLVPLYIGRGYELTGNKTKAIAAYRRCLDICELNYLAICGIERCTDKLEVDLKFDERRVLAVIRTRKTPIAFLGNGLLWQAMDVKPPVVDKMFGMIDVELVLICRRDTRTSVSWDMEYNDRRGVVLFDKINFSTDTALLWRIGQIILVNRRFQPYSEALKTRHRLIASGDIMLHADVPSVPHTWVKAFEFKNIDTSGK